MTNLYANEAFRKMFGHRNIPLCLFRFFILVINVALVDTRHHHSRLYVEVIWCMKFPTRVAQAV